MNFIQWLVSRKKECLVIDSLKAGQADRDDVLLHAAFQVLKDWIEREKGIEWFCKGIHPQDLPEGPHRELYALYLWWTVDRPMRKDMQPPDQDTVAWESKCDEEDQTKLLALVGLRGYLWT